MFDLTQVFSGFIVLLTIVFLGPALIFAAFAKMSGEKVRMPSLAKPVLKVLLDLACGLAALVQMVAQVVAEQLPPKHEHLKPIVALSLKFAIIGVVILLFWCFLAQMAER